MNKYDSIRFDNLIVDISNLSPATYFLRISNGKEYKVEKVMKW